MPALAKGQQKIILGGSVVAQQTKDNGVPGPGNYQPKTQDSIQGFVIVKETNLKKKDLKREVGPETYEPKNPAHTSKSAIIGMS